MKLIHCRSLFFADLFPSLAAVGGEASNDSETLTVRWTFPDQDCFNFSRFEIMCMPLEGEGVASSGENTASGGLESALVRGLTPDTFYSCRIVSSYEGFLVTTTSYTTRPIFTFPPSKSYCNGVCMYIVWGNYCIGEIRITQQTLTNVGNFFIHYWPIVSSLDICLNVFNADSLTILEHKV